MDRSCLPCDTAGTRVHICMIFEFVVRYDPVYASLFRQWCLIEISLAPLTSARFQHALVRPSYLYPYPLRCHKLHRTPLLCRLPPMAAISSIRILHLQRKQLRHLSRKVLLHRLNLLRDLCLWRLSMSLPSSHRQTSPVSYPARRYTHSQKPQSLPTIPSLEELVSDDDTSFTSSSTLTSETSQSFSSALSYRLSSLWLPHAYRPCPPTHCSSLANRSTALENLTTSSRHRQ